jgi:hypothetical protein
VAENVGTDLAEPAHIPADDVLAIDYGPMKQHESRAVARANDFKGPIARAPITIHSKVIIEARCAHDPKPFHNGETCSIDDGKCLIGKGCADRPSSLKVCSRYYFNGYATA